MVSREKQHLGFHNVFVWRRKKRNRNYLEISYDQYALLKKLAVGVDLYMPFEAPIRAATLWMPADSGWLRLQ